MPEMDGFTLVERIKQDPQLANIMVLMLTSAAQKADVTRCRQLDIAVYLMKPVKSRELQQIMMRTLGDERQPRERRYTDSLVGHSQQSLHILLAEDNVDN